MLSGTYEASFKISGRLALETTILLRKRLHSPFDMTEIILIEN